MNILMSAAGSAAAYTIIKHIKSLGHRVIGIDANVHSQDLARSICDEFYLSPMCNSPEFIPFIEKLSDKFDLYIPFIDEELICLSQSVYLSKKIKQKIILCDSQAISICTSKNNFQEYCEQNGLPVAKKADQAPAIFKPEFGRGSKGIFIIDEPELLPYFQKQKGVIQELIKGVEYTVDVLTDLKGDWLFGLARKRLETAGVSRTGLVEQHPEVLALAKKCTEKLTFKGPVNIQIMIDEAGELHLIEINPRLSGSLVFTAKAGFDIIDLTLKVWQGNSIALPQSKDIKPLKFVRYWQEFKC